MLFYKPEPLEILDADKVGGNETHETKKTLSVDGKERGEKVDVK